MDPSGPTAPASAAPRVVGRYAIYDAIASGGMATVHYGRLLGSVGFSRTVAIKRLHPQFAQDPEFVSMFLDEAHLAARIRHPNVVATLDIVALSNEIFLVMDYVHGDSLSRLLRGGAPVPLPVALRIASDTLQGLHAAHEATDEQGTPLHIVHRDVSPHNILVGADGISRVVDFGVAKAAGRAHNTREGHIKGKLCYMAPEQLRGQNATMTRGVDIHALAISLWEMLTGRRLFSGESEADTVAKVVAHRVPPVASIVPGIRPGVEAVIRRGLAPNPKLRYTTAREMCIALEGCGPMASAMAVADWMQDRASGSLAERQSAVRAIEAESTSSPAKLESGEKVQRRDSGAMKFLERLTNPDLEKEAAEAAKLVARSDDISVDAPDSDRQATIERRPPDSDRQPTIERRPPDSDRQPTIEKRVPGKEVETPGVIESGVAKVPSGARASAEGEVAPAKTEGTNPGLGGPKSGVTDDKLSEVDDLLEAEPEAARRLPKPPPPRAHVITPAPTMAGISLAPPAGSLPPPALPMRSTVGVWAVGAAGAVVLVIGLAIFFRGRASPAVDTEAEPVVTAAAPAAPPPPPPAPAAETASVPPPSEPELAPTDSAAAASATAATRAPPSATAVAPAPSRSYGRGKAKHKSVFDSRE